MRYAGKRPDFTMRQTVGRLTCSRSAASAMVQYSVSGVIICYKRIIPSRLLLTHRQCFGFAGSPGTARE